MSCEHRVALPGGVGKRVVIELRQSPGLVEEGLCLVGGCTGIGN